MKIDTLNQIVQTCPSIGEIDIDINDEAIEIIQNKLSSRFTELGLGKDDEPNELGRKIEELMDILLNDHNIT